MKSLRLRLDQLCDRHEELTALLADVEVISDNKRFRKLSREHNDLTEITEVWSKYRQAEEDIETVVMKSDPDFKEMAEEEIKNKNAVALEEQQLMCDDS
jgi:peptide chain release factor 1